ncbi:MAG: Smr/MutS family protein [Pseudomonadota bacterium]
MSRREADEALWQQVTKSVQPLKQRETRRLPTPGARERGASDDAAFADGDDRFWRTLSRNRSGDSAGFADVLGTGSGSSVPGSGHRDGHTNVQDNARMVGLDRSWERAVRRGKLAIDRTIDLHGLTQAVAEQVLTKQASQAHAQGSRILLVITGKGGGGPLSTRRRNEFGELTSSEPGVLRRGLPTWLARGTLAQITLALRPAHIKHGGSGAFYLILKRRRRG